MIETLTQIYLRTLEIDRAVAMKYKDGEEWKDIGLTEFGDTVRHFSMGLTELGVRRGDRVAILSENRPEWTMSDLAILTAGAISVPVYATLIDRQIEYIMRDSGSVAVIVSDAEQMEKIRSIRGGLPSLRHVILCDGAADQGDYTFQSIVERGRSTEAEKGRAAFDQSVRRVTPEDIATIVYTSGTTGEPKGAVLTHGNIASNVKASLDLIPVKPGDVALCILPLTHILERMFDFVLLARGVVIAYNDDLTRTGENLQVIKPNLFASVPRLFEKMQAKILDTVTAKGGISLKLFNWALGVAQEKLPYAVEGKPMPLGMKIKAAVAHAIVFRKILGRLGGNVRFTMSGGAPLSADLAAFFIGAGLEIYEGYGLTETSPVISVNTPEARKLGTVGKPIEGIEVRIAEDGEILTRGPHVMKGYWEKPEATAQAIDPQGWFHTGDIGKIDSDGFLVITDRKKDIIVNAYGKNIAPQPLENQLKTSPWIATPVIIGDRRRFLVALIVPNFERLDKEREKRGESGTEFEELIQKDWVRKIFDEEIARYNAGIDRQEQIRKYTLLPRDFSIEDGEITPSMKVKRRVVEKKYASLIDDLYAEEDLADSR
ncbi:MAG: long-chain fatty acid--CoA ligase [Acidobacteria bacterium]|nr:long-chain fatty acid--CoA ligase [Acidobacteriota bacterium]